MASVTQLSAVMQKVLIEKAEELGESSGFIQRRRVMSGASFVQALVFGWLGNPAASLGELSQSAANVGSGISRQGIAKRFTVKAAEFLRQVLSASVEAVLLEGEAVACEIKTSGGMDALVFGCKTGRMCVIHDIIPRNAANVARRIGGHDIGCLAELTFAQPMESPDARAEWPFLCVILHL